ncbi:MAG TPA: glycerophosphodiester phosphodiesterase family protein, partial [Polyangiaceae bacterium]|nr:glycerophosphodiester phosphodiesterase family protein [Polyangiaceae bacterium]
PTLEVIRRVSAEPRVLLTSFYSYVTCRARLAGYPGPRGLGREEVLFAASLSKLLTSKLFRGRALTGIKGVYSGCRIQIPTAAPGMALDEPDLIRAFHDLGLAVDYWVINDRTRAQQLLERGADGIITDDPRALRSCFEAAAETAAWRARHTQTPVSI